MKFVFVAQMPRLRPTMDGAIYVAQRTSALDAPHNGWQGEDMDNKENIEKLLKEWAETPARLADLLRVGSRSTVQRWKDGMKPQGPVEMWLALLVEQPKLRLWVEEYGRKHPKAVSEEERQRERGRMRWQRKQGEVNDQPEHAADRIETLEPPRDQPGGHRVDE